MFSIWACARVEFNHRPTIAVFIEKPIQKAMPKNWLGAKCVRRLVAKKTPITGRVVAIPSNTPTAKMSHLNLRTTSLRRACQNARARAYRNSVSNTNTAEHSNHPPTACGIHRVRRHAHDCS